MLRVAILAYSGTGEGNRGWDRCSILIEYKTSAACCAVRLRLFFFLLLFSQGLGRVRSGLLGRSIRGSEVGRSDPGDQYEEARRDVPTPEINRRNRGFAF